MLEDEVGKRWYQRGGGSREGKGIDKLRVTGGNGATFGRSLRRGKEELEQVSFNTLFTVPTDLIYCSYKLPSKYPDNAVFGKPISQYRLLSSVPESSVRQT